MPFKHKIKSEEKSEQKIIQAARKLFTEKGYNAIKTRDIAMEAGINLSLLNYYFRSKEKLFEIVMKDNFTQFVKGIAEIVEDRETSFWQKTEILVANYMKMLILNPDMPLFVLSYATRDPMPIKMRELFLNSYYIKQMQQGVDTGNIIPIKPSDFLLNLLGLILFPFIGRHILQNNHGMTKDQFEGLILERKGMIPLWIRAMLNPPAKNKM